MLARYQIVRGQPRSELPDGHRIDTRMHVHHVLSPDAEAVLALLDDPTERAFREFATAYAALLEARFRSERARFDALAEESRARDVYLGCNCPTRKNPDVRRCHTALALAFMRRKYPDLDVRMPG